MGPDCTSHAIFALSTQGSVAGVKVTSLESTLYVCYFKSLTAVSPERLNQAGPELLTSHQPTHLSLSIWKRGRAVVDCLIAFCIATNVHQPVNVYQSVLTVLSIRLCPLGLLNHLTVSLSVYLPVCLPPARLIDLSHSLPPSQAVSLPA